MRRLRTSLLLLAAAPTLLACSDSAKAPPGVASVTVSTPAQSLAVGQTVMLSASTFDAQGNPLTGRSIEWQSSSEAVAQVSAGGAVTGVSPGPVIITARSEGRSGLVSLLVLPVPVASLQITAQGSTSLLPGQTLQLSASTLDAGGGELTGRSISWSSSDTTRVHVTQAGLASAFVAGAATVTATSEGIGASIQLHVGELTDAPLVMSTVPAQLAAGGLAQLHGQNFGATAEANVVTIRGVAVPVLAASPTQLTIQVPCVTPGTVELRVQRSGAPGPPFSAPLTVPTRSVALGEALVLDADAGDCNQIDATPAAARYLVLVYSDVTSAAALLDFRLSGNTPAHAGEAAPHLASARAQPRAPVRDAQWVQDSAHWAVLERERTRYEELRAAAARMPAALLETTAAAVALPQQGDMRSLFYNFGSCQDTTNVIRGRAVYVGSRAIIWEDSANDVQSSVHAQLAHAYQRLGSIFDQDQYRVVRDNFGDPLRRDAMTDNDGRVHMVFTQRLNGSGAAAYVTSCDQFPPSLVRASNHGEFFYGFVPTSTAAGSGNTTTIEGWFPFMSRAVVHEVKHIASMAARVANNAPFEQSWLEEGTARHAEELWVRADLHRVPWKGGTGYGTAADNGVFCDFNLASAACNAHDALRRPSWGMRRHFNEVREKLYEPWNWSPFGTGPGQTGSVFYQTAWSLVRYIADRHGTTEAAFFSALTNSSLSGTANLSAAAGVSFDRMLGLWGAALYADGYPGLEPGADLRFPTWRLRDIYAGLNADPAWNSRWPTPFALSPMILPVGAFNADFEGLRGGAHAYFEIALPPGAAQLLHLQAYGGGPPPTSARVVIARLQ
jgi:hypothetical protein